MHNTEVPKYALDRAVQRRGRVHKFETLAPEKTALVVIDMQNVFVEDGAPIEVPGVRDIIPNVNRLADAVRRTGGRVVWVRMTQAENELIDWSAFYAPADGPIPEAERQAWLAPGSRGQQLYADMDARDGDDVVDKTRYSAFLQGSSDIEDKLRAAGLDTVLIVGTLTNVCCESSARDAMMRNFKVVFISDANGAVTQEDHTATLANIAQVFGDVRTTDETIALLEAGAGGKRAAAE